MMGILKYIFSEVGHKVHFQQLFIKKISPIKLGRATCPHKIGHILAWQPLCRTNGLIKLQIDRQTFWSGKFLLLISPTIKLPTSFITLHTKKTKQHKTNLIYLLSITGKARQGKTKKEAFHPSKPQQDYKEIYIKSTELHTYITIKIEERKQMKNFYFWQFPSK